MFSLKQLFRENTNKRTLRELDSVVRSVNAQEERFALLDDALLRAQTQIFIDRLQSGETFDNILPEAFAVVREAARRVLGERHYDVQIMGGVVLHRHAIAEMRTGEGKTLVATLPAYLNALARKGVHVVTVNDYLSRRDAVWMGQVYAFLGLSVGVVNTQASYLYDPTHKEDSSEDTKRDETGSFKVAYEFLRPCTRREAYEADITYGTNSEFGFDYLRDNIEYEANNLRQRGHHYAIIDEVDSILIDEARTPLIISAPADASGALYATFAEIVRSFVEGEDYTKDEKLRAIQLTDSGIEKAQRALGVENIYTDAGIKYVHHLESSVRAKALFERDRHYVVRDDQIVIVDEFTGRLQPGRRWSEGLHQAVEAKEGVTVQRESRTYASVTYQNFFRMYEKIAGMTGTAETSAEEFYSVYKLDVVQIPTNKKVARIDRNDLIFRNEAGKLSAVVRKVREVHEKGQPILIGTASIDKNEQLSESLARAGVPHEMLNAKNHEREGEIIAQAGRKGAVTIATNMAGRGVDIKLGGSPALPGTADEVRALGGLFVLGTERHEARRIDNQLRGRAGRQGDPGETLFCVSLDDHLMRVFGNHETIKNLMQRATEADDVPIEFGLISRQIESAQKRIEGFHFDSRKRVLAYDDVLNHQRMTVYARRRKYLEGNREAMGVFLAQLSAAHDTYEELVRVKRVEMGDDEFYLALRRLLMQTIDLFWLEHLETMEYLRSSVNLRAYGQRDPLIEYRKEGLRMFRSFETSIADRVMEFLPQMGAGAFASEEERMKRESEKAQQVSSSVTTGISGPVMRSQTLARSHGRNDQVRIEKDGVIREMKYKKAEQFLTQGWKVVE